MDKRFKLWLLISLGLFLINTLIGAWLFPPQPKARPVAGRAAAGRAAGDGPVQEAVEAAPGQPKDEKPAGQLPKAEDVLAKDGERPAAVDAQPRRITLGSADPASPYRMLVTATSVGAAIERIELNSPKYRDLDDRSGYLGHLALADLPKPGGARVQAVGDGTPAALAGVEVEDVIVAVDDKQISSGQQFDAFLKTTKPNRTVKLTVMRGSQRKTLSVRLVRRPLDVVHPERATKALDFVPPGKHDPLSLLLTLQTLDGRALTAPEGGGPGKELDGLDLWNGGWEVAAHTADEVLFRKLLTDDGLELIKRFSLAKVKGQTREDDPSYHLDVEIGIRNVGEKIRTVAYQLDGPTGLPAEGAWYASKVSRSWGAAGLRDVVYRLPGKQPWEETCASIATNEAKAQSETPSYIAVDAQYFAAALIPLKKRAEDVWLSDMRPIRVGDLPKEVGDHKLTNVSFRLTSVPSVLEPNGELRHRYRFFAGPKRPAIVEQYSAMPVVPGSAVSLDDLVYYGWFGWVAKPMLAVLHIFYLLVRNYGIAIVMLTVLVRGAMFPISRKQALSAQKMQELQPQIKALTEKYKSNPQERQRAQMELFRKHHYNPLAGCLPMFLQLPIFVGLYRSLMVDVELRDAPLISAAVRWCSNLAAPDMLFDWSRWAPVFVNQGQGFFGLGPYFNILPIFTIVLFLWQQKLFMPPPTDEQTAMQQKMMKYMMIFMGFMFFKVASGLCLYFIASSLWGIAERKLLPKTLPQGAGGGTADKATAIESPPSSNGIGKRKRRQRS